jgi:hypothetical protein
MHMHMHMHTHPPSHTQHASHTCTRITHTHPASRRYYDRYTELEKAEVREAFQQATDTVNLAHDNHEFVGSFRCV